MHKAISRETCLSWTLALGRIFREGLNYRKAGAMLNSLSPAAQLILRMFGDEKAEWFW
jgi:hypothetical protein